MSKQTKLARYRLLKRIASPLRRLERRFPNSAAIRAAGARLSFIRSVYGVHILNMPGDRTFELCATGYGRFISEAIAAQEKPFLFLDIGPISVSSVCSPQGIRTACKAGLSSPSHRHSRS
jgi:hypothetical protein